MNNLLFYTLIIALLYYFFIYLPQQKKSISSNPPPNTKSFPQNQSTQTDPETITQQINDLGTLNCPGPELEPLLDTLIKEVQTLNKSLK
jgi:hypothetical protein